MLRLLAELLAEQVAEVVSHAIEVLSAETIDAVIAEVDAGELGDQLLEGADVTHLSFR